MPDDESDCFLRSETLALCEIILPVEVAFECLVSLGKLQEPVHLVEHQSQQASSASFRQRSQQKKQCLDLMMEMEALKKLFVGYKEYLCLHDAPGQDPTDASTAGSYELRPKSLIDIEASVSSLRSDMQELNYREAEMNARYVSMLHLINALDCLDSVFFPLQTSVPQQPTQLERSLSLQRLNDASAGQQDESSDSEAAEVQPRSLLCTLGAIPTGKAHALRLKIWRRYHLVALYQDVTVNDLLDLRGSAIGSHNIFIVVSVSSKQKADVDRLCELLGAEVFQVPETRDKRQRLVGSTKDKLSEMHQVFMEGEDHRKRLTLSGWSKWQRWFMQLSLIQCVHSGLAQLSLDSTRRYYCGRLWCPSSSIEAVQCALTEGSAKSSGVKGSVRQLRDCELRPPTRSLDNPLTSAVRRVVHQFGVPRYKEIDPTAFTAVTFPFLFGVMFCDWGHGLILMAFSLLLFASSNRELVHRTVAAGLGPLLPLRHLLLACSLFAAYCGLVCNEGFGRTIGFSGLSRFALGGFNFSWAARHNGDVEIPAALRVGGGMGAVSDPVWGAARNQVKFFNSARMKLSIVLAFAHLLLGLCLQMANDRRFGHWSNLLLFSLPKLLFFALLLGYVVFLILLKWLTLLPGDAACAPALLPMLISMYRFHYTGQPCYLAPFYRWQKIVEHIVVILVACSACAIVVGLPLHHAATKWRRGRESGSGADYKKLGVAVDKNGEISNKISSESSWKVGETSSKTCGAVEFSASAPQFDGLTHSIHCFEFLLSAISHSASYLRLWAIGLAHEEITSIMWPLLLLPQSRLTCRIRQPLLAAGVGGVVLAVSFLLWSAVTVCLLVGLEGMTALLHSLRLHWIEFQSKFYCGDGYKFKEFSLKATEQQAKETVRQFLESDAERP